MNIEELRKHRQLLEATLCEVIGVELQKFRNETGMCVHDVYLSFMDVTRMMDTQKQQVLTGVRVEVERI